MRTRNGALARVAAWIALALLCAGLQWRSGAYHCDLSGHPDEAAHAVSALLVHDYIAAGFPGNPVRYAVRYYLHYPKVAIGHYPPLYYGVLGTWMLLFGRSAAAMLFFLAAAEIALTIGIYELARRECGSLAALMCAIVFATTRLVQQSADMIMPDLVVGCLVLAAAAAYGLYLEQGRRRDAILFAILTAAAVATHGRGLVVATVPIFCAWIAPREKLSKAKLAAGVLSIAALIAVPPLTYQSYPPTLTSVGSDTLARFVRMGIDFGLLAVLALVASAQILKTRPRNRWTAMVALAAANLVFFSGINLPWEDRYFLTLAPCVALLAARGWNMLSGSRWAFAVVATAAVCTTIWNVAPLKKKDLGYGELPARLSRVDRVTLIAGPPEAEGALIASILIRDRNFDFIVLRASKELATSGWSGSDYQLKFHNTDEIREYLARMCVGTVVVAPSGTAPHMALLESAIDHDPRWHEVAGVSANARVFQTDLPPPHVPLHLQVDNPGHMNRAFQLDEP